MNKKILIAYYSAEGHTKSVAEKLAQNLSADLFEIIPKNVYTPEDLDWTNSNSRATREHDNESLRNVPLLKTTPENWNEYDMILIGYPIWWGIAAWPVDNFVKENDFTGKAVIPFATSASSSLSESGELLKSMSTSGDWKSGHRFYSDSSNQELQDWANEIIK